MAIALYYALFVANLLFAIGGKRNRVFEIATFVFMGLLFTLNDCTIGDLFIYKSYYANLHVGSGMEYGYVQIANLFSRANLSFNVFLLAIFLFCSVFIFLGMKVLKVKNFHALFAISMPYIFPMMSISLRYFIGGSITFFAICMYLRNHNRILLIALILLATLFHRTMIMFLIFVFVNFSDRTRFGVKIRDRKIRFSDVVFILAVLLAAASILNHNRIPFIGSIVSLVEKAIPQLRGKFDAYLTTTTNRGYLIFYIAYFAGLFGVYILRDHFNAPKQGLRGNGNAQVANNVCQMFLLMAILLPLMLMNLVFFRHIMILFMLLGAAFGLNKNKGKYTQTNALQAVALALSSVVWFLPEMLFVFSMDIKTLIEYCIIF